MDAPQIALTDDLTGTWNRRYLRELFEQDWERLVEAHGRMAMLVLDLDAFKPVNDRHGHLVGDSVLRAVAALLAESFREGDRLVRYGGDEFVVVLPGVGPQEARELGERARAALAEKEWIDPASGRDVEHRVSFSIGVGVAPDDGTGGDAVLEAADRRLYEEKNRRRSTRKARRARRRRWALGAPLAVGLLMVAVVVRFAWHSAPVSPSMAPAVRTELAVDEAEIETLRAEVRRLSEALTAERSQTTREEYEARIRELEETLAAVERRPPARSGAGAAAETPPGAGSTASVRPAGRAPAPAAPAPADATPGPGRDAAPAPAAGAPDRVLPPRLLRHQAPVYPPIALQRRLEATVELSLTVDAAGQVVTVEPIGPPAGFGFDEAARRAALSAIYQPGTRGGRAVPMKTTLQIRFILDRPGRR